MESVTIESSWIIEVMFKSKILNTNRLTGSQIEFVFFGGWRDDEWSYLGVADCWLDKTFDDVTN